MSPLVSVVIVTFNSERVIRDCLGAVERAMVGVENEIIVVDNASDDATCSLVTAFAPHATLVRNSANTGFGAASNTGLRAGGGAYKMLLNPDTVAWPGSVARLMSYMEEHPRCGVAGPRLHDSDGTAQFSVFNFPTPGNQLFESLFLHRLAPRLTPRFGEVVYDLESYAGSHSVGWVSGAAMLLRSSALDEVGLLDERFFMYSEEKDLCYRMHCDGWSVDYVADAHVTHAHDGRVTPEAFANQLRSKMAYFEKHYSGVYRLGCKAALVLGFGIRIVAGGFAALVGSGRRDSLLVPLRGIPIYLREARQARRREVAA